MFVSLRHRHEKMYLFLFQVAPFPYDLVRAELDKYPHADIHWLQEEHKNMGFYDFCRPRITTASEWTRRVQ